MIWRLRNSCHNMVDEIDTKLLMDPRNVNSLKLLEPYLIRSLGDEFGAVIDSTRLMFTKWACSRMREHGLNRERRFDRHRT